ncbi:sulfhydryl oxidase 2-like isoform X2 [Gigantopelta aegis]|uniref:sulfhydryl oxidase 2-like isoform X2 n=1 Tax=Gigantopelta aegis TaxID=1735272 RepID=UPI001B889020|nr:sulfhydryl oxidase 2-like isoform X2 [Gigantopelta aegis]
MGRCHSLCLSLLIAYLIGLSFADIPKEAGLYLPGDDVVVISGDDFYSHLADKEHAWIIEFYNTWCGHCINFAPTYKKFAQSIKGWSRVISVGAVDCSQPKNTDVCRKYGIESYPQMILFPPHSTDKNTGLRLFGTREFGGLLENVVDFVSNRTRFQAPASWPRLQPMATIEEIWSEASPKHQHVVLIFEDRNSITGREIILDTMDQTHILVRRLLKESVTKYGITQFPSLYSLKKDGVYKKLAVGVGGENDRASFVGVIKERFGINVNEGEEDGAGIGEEADNKNKNDKDNEELPAPATNIVGVHMQDLESALTYAFRQEIAIHKSMNQEALSALKTFVVVLAKYSPVRKPISSFLWKVADWLNGVNTELSGEQWSNHIDTLQTKDSFLPDAVIWTGCHGSKLKYRGYPCSMWTLFHTLTVSSYLANKHTVPHNPQEVLLAIRGYMKNFFGCAECSKNFYKMAVTLEKEVKQSQDAVLWLWSAHNKANKRLHGQPSEDPLFPKIQFPSQTTCPKCHKAGSTNTHPIWDKDEVLNFMVHMYREENIRHDVSKKPTDQGTNNHILEGERTSRVTEELDWWEKQQRKQDLHKIQELRSKKKKSLEERFVKRESTDPRLHRRGAKKTIILKAREDVGSQVRKKRWKSTD